MKLILCAFILLLIGLISCGGSSAIERSNFDWSGFSAQVRDSLIHMELSGHIPSSISGVAATEPRGYSKLVWILDNAKTKEFSKLLYEHPSGELKAIAVKGLIRRYDKDLFEHLKFAVDQDIDVRYYMSCQKLGGYFLNELSYVPTSNLERYFSTAEVEEIEILISNKDFECD